MIKWCNTMFRLDKYATCDRARFENWIAHDVACALARFLVKELNQKERELKLRQAFMEQIMKCYDNGGFIIKKKWWQIWKKYIFVRFDGVASSDQSEKPLVIMTRLGGPFGHLG